MPYLAICSFIKFLDANRDEDNLLNLISSSLSIAISTAKFSRRFDEWFLCETANADRQHSLAEVITTNIYIYKIKNFLMKPQPGLRALYVIWPGNRIWPIIQQCTGITRGAASELYKSVDNAENLRSTLPLIFLLQ